MARKRGLAVTVFVLTVIAIALGAALVVAWPLLRAARVPHAPWLAAACIPVVLAGVGLALRENPPGPAPALKEGLATPHGPGTADGETWVRRARAQAEAGRFADAAASYEEARRRLPPSAAILAERADTLAMARGRRFDGEPDRLIAEALALDPRHVKALALSGTSAYTRGDFATAARQWRALLAVLPPGGPAAREVSQRLSDAERRALPGG
jgi:cytochrome c-type biogenesis protein CcmH/NrfG